jgi:hypothetical protein
MDERIPLVSAVTVALWFVACGGTVDHGPSDQNENEISKCPECLDDANEASGGSASKPNPSPGTGGSSAPSGPIEPNPDPEEIEPDPDPAEDPPPSSAPSAGGIAIPFNEIPSSGSSSGSTGGGGQPLDPNRIYITFGSQKPVCESPYRSGGCGHWKVGFGVPPERLKAGEVIPLTDAELNSYSSFSGPDRGGGDCYGGGGSFIAGTLEIVNVDDDKIVIRLEDTWTFDFDANGEHVIDRCH